MKHQVRLNLLRLRVFVFPWNRKLRRRPDSVNRRKAALVDREPKTSARIDIDQWALEWDIAESLHERQIDRLLANRHRDRLPPLVAKFQELFRVHVRDQVSERPIRSVQISVPSLRIRTTHMPLESH